MRMLVGLFLLLGVSAMARGEDFVFETDYARYVIASNGLSKSLLEKKTGREWLLPKPTPLAQVKNGGRAFPALAESDTVLRNPEIAIGNARMALPTELKTGDYAEFWADGGRTSAVRTFDRNGVSLSTVSPTGTTPPELPAGESRIRLDGASGPAELTVITLGGPALR